MDFKQLQSYISVIKYKSFSIAAEKIGISQPTISTHIRILEEELNSRLLIRTAKSFQITPRGWELYECAQNILKLRDDMVERWNGSRQQEIHLGVSSIPSAYILPQVLPAFGEAHEEISFVVNQSDSQAIIDAVHKGTYDIGLVGMKIEDELLEFQQFYQDRMVLITPANDYYRKWKKGVSEDFRELSLEPMILREKGSGTGKSAERLLEKLGLKEEQLHIVARMNDAESIKNLVVGGLGVAIVSEKSVENEVKTDRLLKLELPREFAIRDFYIIYQKEYILKNSVKDFINYLMEHYKYTEK